MSVRCLWKVAFFFQARHMDWMETTVHIQTLTQAGRQAGMQTQLCSLADQTAVV